MYIPFFKMHINIVLIVLSTCVYEYVLLNHNFHNIVTVEDLVVLGSAKEQKARERYILFSLKISVFRIKYLKVFKESYT